MLLWSDKMKNILVAGALMMCILASSASFSDASNGDDCDNAKLVRSWVELQPWVTQGNSFLEKNIYRNGDGIALGIARAFTQEELLDPDRLGRILSIIRLSFSQPNYIARDQDRRPAVTRLLLVFLENQSADSKTKRSIADAEAYVSSQVAHP
jgi:hypothetical protein